MGSACGLHGANGGNMMKRKVCSILVAGLMLASSLTAFAADETAAGGTTPEAVTTTPAAIATTPAAVTTTPAAVTTTPAAVITTPAAVITTPEAVTTTPAAIPKDVAGTAYEEAVKSLIDKGVVSGYADGTYKPGNSITRAEACAIIVKYLAPAREDLDKAKENTFTDMKGNWAAAYVNYALEKGIVKGYKDNTFKPDAQVTYDEMATMVVNALGFTEKDLTGTWPASYVNKAKELGVFAAINVGNFGEKASSRGDVAEMLYSADKYKDGGAKKAAEALISGAAIKEKELKSMTYSLTSDIAMTVKDEKISMKMAGDVSLILEPMTMKMAMKVDGGGVSSTVETYMIPEKDALMMYSLADGKWTKFAMGDAKALAQYNAMDNMELYMSGFDIVRLEGKDMVNGKPATKLYCTMADDYLQKALGVAGVQDTLKGSGMSLEDLQKLYKDVKDLNYYLWIDDATGAVVKYEIDMTNAMTQVMANMAAALKDDQTAEKEALSSIKYDKMIMDMVVTGVNNVKEIALPDGAKDAMVITPGAITTATPGAITPAAVTN